ncbi:type 4b pilus protein PilO2 [Pseudomonas aeruginosa]
MEKPDLGSRGPDVSILSYHGNKFVSGLFWRPLSSQRQYMKEARKLGKEEHLDIVAIRHSPTVIQAGFVSKSQGAVKGMYSLASALSGQFDGDFLACWKVDEDRYALVATLDGAIVPGQDVVTSLRRGPGPGQEALYARRAAKRTGLRSRRVRFPRQELRH